MWLKKGGGTVYDLSQLDYGTSGQLLAFEAEAGDGFMDIEVED